VGHRVRLDGRSQLSLLICTPLARLDVFPLDRCSPRVGRLARSRRFGRPAGLASRLLAFLLLRLFVVIVATVATVATVSTVDYLGFGF